MSTDAVDTVMKSTGESDTSGARDAARQYGPRFRGLLEAAPDGMVAIDEHGRIVLVNRRIESMFGYRRGELLGQPVDLLEIPGPGHGGEPPGPCEGLGRRKDGSTFPVEVSVSSIDAPEGRLAVAGVRDVTERHQLEERYRVFSEMTSDIVYVLRVGEDGAIEPEWIAGAIEETGYRPEDWSELGGWAGVVHPDDHPLAGRIIDRVLAGEPSVDELRIVTRSGEVRWLRAYVRPERDQQTGRITRLYGAAQDVTSRARATEELARREAMLREAQAVGSLGSWLRVTGADEMRWSDEMYRLCGVDRRTFVPSLSAFLELCHPDDRPRVVEATEHVVERGDPVEIECRIIRPSGEIRWVRLRRLPKLDASGNVVEMYGTVQDVTERRELEQRFQRVAEMTSDVAGAYHIDEDGEPVVEWVTGPLEDIIGYTLEEALELHWRRLVVPDDREAYERRMDRLLAGEEVEQEFRCYAKDGTIRWLNTWARPVPDEATGRLTIYSAIRDVTDRRCAEDALARSEEMLREAEAIAHLGTWRHDLGSERLVWSEEMYKLHGRSPSEGDPSPAAMLAYVHPADRGEVERAWRYAIEAQGPIAHEYRVLDGSGSARWVTARTRAEVDSRGRTVALQGTCLDITGRREVEERNRVLYQLISDGAYSHRVEEGGELVPEWASESFARLLGYEGHDALDLLHRWHEFVHPDDRSIVEAAAKAARSGRPDVPEFRVVTRPGEERWVRAYSCPVVDDTTGAVCRVYSALQDTTDRKLAVQAMKEAYEREHEAAQRLREVKRLKDDFISTVSHELRTPITAVLGFAQTLAKHEDRFDDATRAHMLDRLSDNAAAMASMIDRLLDFSRLVNGTVALEVDGLDLAAATLDCVQDHVALLERHQLEVAVPDGLMVAADTAALHHVLGNLLANAAKYSLEGSRIRIAAHAEDGFVVVDVQDEGRGIEPGARSRIFERFYRAANVLPGDRGAGVGLAIARGYVELMGGRIWVESEPGRGSTFSFTLPAAAPAREPVLGHFDSG